MGDGLFASAISEHPITVHAVGEVAGQVLESIGQQPDLAFLFVTPPHAGALEDAANVVRTVLSPTVLLGCAAVSVVGINKEVEEGPAVCLWAGKVGQLRGVELTSVAGEVVGWPEDLAFEPELVVLLADPYSFPAEAFFSDLAKRYPGVPVTGGNASAAMGPGGNRLTLDGRVQSGDAVAAILGAGSSVKTVVSQGCRPVGHPLVVTKAEGNIIYELAGRPALDRLQHLAKESLSQQEVNAVNSGGLHIGLVIDEHKAVFGRGDFLVRNVLGADRANGAMAVAEEVQLGTTVQFHLRDAVAADEDLRAMLAGHRAQAALVFTCNGRGIRMFSRPDHDAKVVGAALGEVPTAGMFAAGEFGPVGGANFVHGFTASIALFGDRS